MRLTPEAEAQGFRLTAFGTVGSTNDEALAAARAGDPGQHWFTAAEQTRGRGRHGRDWSSPHGNLYASLLLVEPCEPARAPELGFVAGVALHEAVRRAAGVGAPRLSLKWPNDLLLDGAKVAGLLVEGHWAGAASAFTAVVGIGVNVSSAATGTPYPARFLQEVAPGLAAESLFEALASTFAEAHGAWRRGEGAGGFAAIRRDWLARAAGVGTPVTLRLPDGPKSGTFSGLDASGRLQLRTAEGVETIDAGDLYFANPQPAAPDAAPHQLRTFS